MRDNKQVYDNPGLSICSGRNCRIINLISPCYNIYLYCHGGIIILKKCPSSVYCTRKFIQLMNLVMLTSGTMFNHYSFVIRIQQFYNRDTT